MSKSYEQKRENSQASTSQQLALLTRPATIDAITDYTIQMKLVLAKKKKAVRRVEKGYLKIVRSNGREQYYHVVQEHGVKTQTYISQNDVQKLERLAQKSYDLKVISLAEKEILAWETLLSLLPDDTIVDVVEQLAPARQKFIAPIVETDESYRKRWEAVTYEPGWFRDGAPVYITDRGERVRSKSELLIANLLYKLGIPYRYEYPVTIVVDGREKTWRPDFMILDVKNRKEYFLEHFGMMDDASDSNYSLNALQKMQIYEENGMYEGKNMIYSFETSFAPVNLKYLEMKLKRVLAID